MNVRDFGPSWYRAVDPRKRRASFLCQPTTRINASITETEPQKKRTRRTRVVSIVGFMVPRMHMSQRGRELTLVFDTETTGLCREDQVIQLGYLLYDGYGNELRRYERLLRTERRIHPQALRTHGISERELSEKGSDPLPEIGCFADLVTRLRKNHGTLVAHNMAFDLRLLRQTFLAHGVRLECGRTFCTLRNLRGVPRSERGENRTNVGVYEFLKGPAVGQGRAHRALYDAQMTSFIYFHGKRVGWWV